MSVIAKFGKCPLCDNEIVITLSMRDVSLRGRNVTCSRCKQFIWVPIEGAMVCAIKKTLGREINLVGDIESIRDVKCPVCDYEFVIKFNDKELDDGGKNVFCPKTKCRISLWVPVFGNLEGYNKD
ncbi:MAG: hypothetical protein US71_C0004G0016 [Parcubacteria group bacterium GW2011_GWD2_38_12]|nr:MAG: hypothetical protein US06_C0007G0026 [Parcubacteria group bacterium GW2011_GWC2_36_17]KKQ52291.1 MAG: hypothetical protein US71_C0004G0016 [Parcubacteria group bacterium GW2011_GWD2_38_12]KKQ58576.1 MAG: hypothetical protein US79_C0005G0028 [Parcubacteria group bacterium GW2011_GWC1_38_17]KKQ75447.1 MAG: hypothetical protein US97_C0040G0004 [Microgenomates group bacterium GW2011_GWF1_38_5]